MIQQHRTEWRRTPPKAEHAARERRLWADVAELTRSVMGSAPPPPGFVRREIPVAGSRAAAYTGVTARNGDHMATVVVVIAPPAPTCLDRGALQRRFGLTPREAEVALMLAARKSNKEIAAQLSIAQKTAWRHTERVLSKLNAGSRLDVRGVLEAEVDE
jgi:DNA-binding CsgD family transcriptional regulator